MRGIAELDHYELFEIPRAATPSQIERAYRTQQHTYAEGSLAMYSLFESLDADAIRDRLDEAYRVLSDPESREAYDRDLSEPITVSGSSDSATVVGALDDSAKEQTERRFDGLDDGIEEYDTFDEDADGEFDGLRLRRARLFRGYEIEDISDVTKVSGSHLRNIEDENFQDLPADVYVRGFVTAYAQTIGLDPNVVVPGYMARVQESRTAQERGRFLARR